VRASDAICCILIRWYQKNAAMLMPYPNPCKRGWNEQRSSRACHQVQTST
jgi:hypothetical protein